jgi:hypothetical protein
MVKLFNEAEGKYDKAHGDDVIRLLFKCHKRRNEPPNGELAKLLLALGLDATCSYWDIKKRIWEVLRIETAPVKLATERLSINQRNIDNAAEVQILRSREGKLLLSALRLPESASLRELECTIIERVLELRSDFPA